jgi:hypothetical protein
MLGPHDQSSYKILDEHGKSPDTDMTCRLRCHLSGSDSINIYDVT